MARALSVRGLGRPPLRARRRAGAGARPGDAERARCGRARGRPSTTPPCATDPGLPRALDGVSLRLPPGGRVAVTGSSGAGKSSLVTALLRYWPLESGSLSLGGTDVTRLPQADVRGACALADQRAQLFAGTVRVQPHPGPPRRHRERDRAPRLRAARLDEWVATLPEGLDTPVGEDGVASRAASGGGWPWPAPCWRPGRCLILDEPTSGLDAALADELVDGVLRRGRGRAACC